MAAFNLHYSGSRWSANVFGTWTEDGTNPHMELILKSIGVIVLFR